MKRIIPFFTAAAVVCSFSADALAQSVKRLPRLERIDGNRAVIVTEVVRTPRVIAPEIRTGVGTAVVPAETTAVGAETEGVAWSTGAGIGEPSTRADVGDGRGGAGIVRSGTLAPRAVRRGNQVIWTVPGELVPAAGGGYVIRPTIPRETMNRNTLGAGTSTPVGVAPGY